MGPTEPNGKLNPEVTANPTRRHLSADLKQSVINQAAAREANGGSVGEMLRQNSLYRAQLAEWRRTLAKHGAAGLVGHKLSMRTSSEGSAITSRARRAASALVRLITMT